MIPLLLALILSSQAGSITSMNILIPAITDVDDLSRYSNSSTLEISSQEELRQCVSTAKYMFKGVEFESITYIGNNCCWGELE